MFYKDAELEKVWFIWNKTRINANTIILGVVLSILSAFLEGVSLGLILPTLEGVAKMDYTSLTQNQVLGGILNVIPTERIELIFIFLILLIFLVTVIKNILSYFSSICFVLWKNSFIHALRREIFTQYMGFGMHYFDKCNRGQLKSVLIEYTNNLSIGLIQVFSIIQSAATVVVYFVIMMYISWQLTLIILILLPLLQSIFYQIRKRIIRTSKDRIESQKNINEYIYNTLSCIPLIKIYNNEEHEKRKFSDLNEVFLGFEYSQRKKASLIGPLNEVTTAGFVVILAVIMALFLIDAKSGGLTKFIVFFYILKKSSVMYGTLNNARAIISERWGDMDEMINVFKDFEKHAITDGKKEFPGLVDKIELVNLSFSYSKEVPVLKDVSFEMKKGQVTALVGPTGSGKTTIATLIMRFYDVAENTIKIDGTDIREYTAESLRNQMALVSQDQLLFNDTIEANLLYGQKHTVTSGEIESVLDKARLSALIKKLPDGIKTRIGDNGVQLSGGEKQRLAIARAILKKSEILVLDEATSSLDSETEKLVQ
ncbi:MAG: ABC transporter ATP-binding protein/permease, partial [Candidatus Altiarchaeota archaeon]|nr:ABC transporter ATP-binding protein/permease [Candidatus Altiarchaeota archaeon]